jgi:hypothetical protein
LENKKLFILNKQLNILKLKIMKTTSEQHLSITDIKPLIENIIKDIEDYKKTSPYFIVLNLINKLKNKK